MEFTMHARRRSLPFIQPRRIVLFGAALVLLGMLLYPPFHVVTQGARLNVGYGWLFAPPGVHTAFGVSRSAATVDTSMLITQYLGVLLAAALLHGALPTEPPQPSVPAASVEDSQRVLDAILESDVVALHAALTQLISVEAARRSRAWTGAE